MGTGSSQRAVSNLDFEPRMKREFQNTSRGVRDKSLTPPSQRPKFLLFPASSLLMNDDLSYFYHNCIFLILIIQDSLIINISDKLAGGGSKTNNL
ncbi:hypothetical protein CPR19088_GLDEOEPO_00994 [Companilactobacillus paralimentarius]